VDGEGDLPSTFFAGTSSGVGFAADLEVADIWTSQPTGKVKAARSNRVFTARMISPREGGQPFQG
jgi:hypothetical protein